MLAELPAAIETATDWGNLLVPLGSGIAGLGGCILIARKLWQLYTQGLNEENARLRKDLEDERDEHEKTKKERKADLKLLYDTQVENARLRVALAGVTPTVTVQTPAVIIQPTPEATPALPPAPEEGRDD